MKININKEMDESHKSLMDMLRKKRNGEDVFNVTEEIDAEEFKRAIDDLLRESEE